MKELSYWSRWLGFHEDFMLHIDDSTNRDRLELVNLVVAVGLVLMALALGALVWMLSPSGAAYGLAAAGVTVLAGLVLFKAHALLIHLGGVSLSEPALRLEQWRPNALRLFAFTAVAVCLAQPLLMALHHSRLERAAIERIQFRTTVQFEAQERSRLLDRQQELLLQRSVLTDEKQRISLAAGVVSGKISTPAIVGSTRKALLIGASNYAFGINQLPGVFKDIVAMERKLRSMGYIVTVSLDDSRAEIRRKIQEYSASLRSGDISLIYLAGHGLESAGQNYFIPQDYATHRKTLFSRETLQNHAILLTPLIDDLTRERLRLHMLILDACRTDIDGKPRGLAAMQSLTSRNVIISMSASPGQEALDALENQKDGNSPFAAALLRNLDKDEDVGRVLRRVTREVVEVTAPELRKKNQPPQTPWLSESVVDLEIKLVSPMLNAKAALSEKAVSKLSELAPLCSTNYERNGDAKAFSACLSQELAAMNRQIEFIEDRLSSEAGQSAPVLSGLLQWAVFFTERLRALWIDYIPAFWGTLLLALGMTGGLYMRDLLFPKWLRGYECVRHRLQRIALREYYAHNQAAINLATASAKAKERLPGFEHWSAEEGFFGKALPRQAFADAADARVTAKAAEGMWTWLQTLSTQQNKV